MSDGIVVRERDHNISYAVNTNRIEYMEEDRCLEEVGSQQKGTSQGDGHFRQSGQHVSIQWRSLQQGTAVY